MNRFYVFILYSISTIIVAGGSLCPDIEGYWYNQLGSEVLFKEFSDGTLEGEYRTAVERKVGSAGDSYADIRGLTTRYASGNLVVFTTNYNKGKSTVAWGGQCLKCDENAELKTIWLMKEEAEKCNEEWGTVTINEDIFTRQSIKSGPRKLDGTNVPERSDIWESSTLRENLINEHTIASKPFEGKWYTAEGYILDLNIVEDKNEMNGTFFDQKYFTKPTTLIGTISESNLFGLTVADGEHKKAAIAVGQYHTCEGKEILETYWLRIKEQQSCTEENHGSHFRRMQFTRTASVESTKGEKAHFSTMFSNFSTSVSNFFLNMFGKKQ